ncbi:agouti-related protein [Synchiropus splendidus]|uniref:agouti-related protein n=1 Tax=Synchiropus splendidus TaxID=270530 RepID=UPI00237DD970|nr:agouti-related protein [Synchiropus splendidus]
MFGSVLLCFLMASLSSSLVHENLQLDPGQVPSSRLQNPAYLPDLERDRAPEGGQSPSRLADDSVEERLLMDVASYEDSLGSSPLQGRAMRSPRRCVPHQQSCLGMPLPCCDPCDTCYCRFFNAICYCRRVGHACLPPRT